MALSDEARERIFRAVEMRARGVRCLFCEQSTWSVGGEGFIVLPMVDLAGNPVPNGAAIGCVSVTCRTCGEVHLFNLASPGLRELLPPE